jgi:hypothetical protein
MINKIPDFNIRETTLEETSEAKEEQPQENISPESKPAVQASPEYKAGLITERRLAGQAQEMLLRNQVADLDEPVIDLDEPEPPSLKDKSIPQLYKETLEEVPQRLKDTAAEVGKTWSDPGQALSDIKKDAESRWNDIKNGK